MTKGSNVLSDRNRAIASWSEIPRILRSSNAIATRRIIAPFYAFWHFFFACCCGLMLLPDDPSNAFETGYVAQQILGYARVQVNPRLLFSGEFFAAIQSLDQFRLQRDAPQLR